MKIYSELIQIHKFQLLNLKMNIKLNLLLFTYDRIVYFKKYKK